MDLELPRAPTAHQPVGERRAVGAPPEAGNGFARISWRTCGRNGEDRLAQAGISVRCLLRVDDQPVDDTDDDAVEALLARAY